MNKSTTAGKVCKAGTNLCVKSTDVERYLKKGAVLGACTSGGALSVTKQVLQDVLANKTVSELTVKAFPNPTQSYFTLKLSGDDLQGEITVRVMDLNGKVIEQRNRLSAGQT